MDISGKVIAVLQLQQGTSKSTNREWSKQEFVIETQDQYPKKVCFQLFGEERVKMCPKVGDEVCVKFDVNAREYQGRWFNQIDAWSVEVKQPAEIAQPAETAQETQAEQPQAAPTPAQQAPQTAQESDDSLPF